MTALRKTTKIMPGKSIVLLGKKKSDYSIYGLSKDEVEYALNQFGKTEKKCVVLNQLKRMVYIQLIEEKEDPNLTLESCRRAGSLLVSRANSGKINEIV